MVKSSRRFCTISIAAIVLSAALGFLITPACSLAQSSPRHPEGGSIALNYTTPRVISATCPFETHTLVQECICGCPRQRLGHMMVFDKKCIQRCRRYE